MGDVKRALCLVLLGFVASAQNVTFEKGGLFVGTPSVVVRAEPRKLVVSLDNGTEAAWIDSSGYVHIRKGVDPRVVIAIMAKTILQIDELHRNCQ